MSFSAQDFSVLAYANGFTHWHYRTRDRFQDLMAPPLAANDNGYFAAARDMLRQGDQITVNLLGAENTGLAQFVVAAMTGEGLVRLALLAATPQPTPLPAARAA